MFGNLINQVYVENRRPHYIDLTVCFEERVYIFEFKVNELTKPGCALEQIKGKKYAEKYQGQRKEIWLVGVEFSRTERNISRFGWEKG